MHVVSRDLEKAKTKKHYLSFADPGFFLDVGWVCSELRARGRVAYDVADKERLLREQEEQRRGTRRRLVPPNAVAPAYRGQNAPAQERALPLLQSLV